MKIPLLLGSWLLATSVAASVPFQGALNGFPANPYDPFCAMSCLRSLYDLTLSCSSTGDTIGMVTFTTSSACWAENTPYLTSLAWCTESLITVIFVSNTVAMQATNVSQTKLEEKEHNSGPKTATIHYDLLLLLSALKWTQLCSQRDRKVLKRLGFRALL